MKNVKVTAHSVRVGIAKRTNAPAVAIARAAVSQRLGPNRTTGRIIAQEAGKWIEWEIVPV